MLFDTELIVGFQMQFAWFILHSVQVMYIGCGFPRAYMVCQFIFALSQLVLFMNFYLQTYRNQNEIKKVKTSWQIYIEDCCSQQNVFRLRVSVVTHGCFKSNLSYHYFVGWLCKNCTS